MKLIFLQFAMYRLSKERHDVAGVIEANHGKAMNIRAFQKIHTRGSLTEIPDAGERQTQDAAPDYRAAQI